jgi:type II secretory pathway pseudopilin PulG
MELLAVIAIIAILSGLGAKGYSLARRQAKESRAKADIEKLRAALVEYRIEFGAYPTDLSNTDFLTHAVEGIEFNDPWGRAYQYECTNRFLYRIWSDGQDDESAADNIEPSNAGY